MSNMVFYPRASFYLFSPHNSSMCVDFCIPVIPQLGHGVKSPEFSFNPLLCMCLVITNLVPRHSLQVIIVFGTLVNVNSLSGVQRFSDGMMLLTSRTDG